MFKIFLSDVCVKTVLKPSAAANACGAAANACGGAANTCGGAANTCGGAAIDENWKWQ